MGNILLAHSNDHCAIVEMFVLVLSYSLDWTDNVYNSSVKWLSDLQNSLCFVPAQVGIKDAFDHYMVAWRYLVDKRCQSSWKYQINKAYMFPIFGFNLTNLHRERINFAVTILSRVGKKGLYIIINLWYVADIFQMSPESIRHKIC